MNDVAPAAARRWVQQEFANASTPEARALRAESERKMQAMLQACGLVGLMPNSEWAHAELLRLCEGGAP